MEVERQQQEEEEEKEEVYEEVGEEEKLVKQDINPYIYFKSLYGVIKKMNDTADSLGCAVL